MHAARSTATLHAGSARWTWGGPHPEPDFLRSRPSVWLRFDSYRMTQPQTTTELEQSCSISKKNMITKIFKVRKRREMLFVQVCFICSVLFVAWCMSVLLTKTGKCPYMFWWCWTSLFMRVIIVLCIINSPIQGSSTDLSFFFFFFWDCRRSIIHSGLNGKASIPSLRIQMITQRWLKASSVILCVYTSVGIVTRCTVYSHLCVC